MKKYFTVLLALLAIFATSFASEGDPYYLYVTAYENNGPTSPAQNVFASVQVGSDPIFTGTTNMSGEFNTIHYGTPGNVNWTSFVACPAGWDFQQPTDGYSSSTLSTIHHIHVFNAHDNDFEEE